MHIVRPSLQSVSAMLGMRYRHFTVLSEGGPTLPRCGTLHSAAQCCTVSHSATAWVRKSGIADEVNASISLRKFCKHCTEQVRTVASLLPCCQASNVVPALLKDGCGPIGPATLMSSTRRRRRTFGRTCCTSCVSAPIWCRRIADATQ